MDSEKSNLIISHLTLQTSGCDDNFLKESVIKNVKGVMQSKIETA